MTLQFSGGATGQGKSGELGEGIVLIVELGGDDLQTDRDMKTTEIERERERNLHLLPARDEKDEVVG